MIFPRTLFHGATGSSDLRTERLPCFVKEGAEVMACKNIAVMERLLCFVKEPGNRCTTGCKRWGEGPVNRK